MKITKVTVRTVAVLRPMPAALPADLAKALSAPLPVTVVEVESDSGITGLGYTITLNSEFTRSLHRMVEELGTLVIGADPRRPEQILAGLIYPANWIGPGGMLNIAAHAIDVAIWDLYGKECGQPLWRLLGGFTNRVRVYDSGSLLADDLDSLQRAAADAVALGHRAIKMRPGSDRHGPVRDVVRRVKAVRDAIGPDVALMYDVNQTWTPSRAIRAGRALEEFELTWIEDPTLMHDIDGQAAVARALDTPICSGEYHYEPNNLRRLLEARAVDHLMVDMMRMAGITQFRKVAGMAEAFGVQVASHLIPEVFAHCIAAIPNGLIVEGMPWTEAIFREVPQVADGYLTLSEQPGHGLELDEAYVTKHQII